MRRKCSYLFSKEFYREDVFWLCVNEPSIILNEPLFSQYYPLHEKCPNTELFLACIFLYSDQK